LLAALGLIFRRQKMSWSAREAMALFFLPLVPVSGLFAFSFQNHSTVADRYMYMPLIGLSLGLALVVRLGARSLLYIMTVAILTGAVAIFLAASSYHQADHWATNAQLLAQMQAVNPKSYMAENNLGVLAASANRPDEALKHFQRAQALNPNLSEVSTNIGAALERMGDLEGAAKQFEKVVAQDEAVFAAQAGLGAVLLKLHRESEARAHLERAIQLNAFNADALNNYAVALSLTGDRSRAVQFFEKAVERDPHNETFRRNFEAAKSAR
jgi:Flp pilus assembly protein TadD